MNRPKIWNRREMTIELEPVVFKHWTRKKWAVKASLNSVIIIGMLCVSYQMVAQEKAGERSDTTQGRIVIELEEVEASGRGAAGLEDVSLQPVIQVISSDIREAAATSQEDLLEILPMVDIRQRGKYGTQADLCIQGGTFDESMVLLDGIDISDPQTGHFQLNIPPGLLATERIELVTGSAARKFGMNAFAGAVNIITEPSDSNSFAGVLKAGQHRFYQSGLKVNMGGNHVSTLASAVTSGSRGYRSNTDFRNINTFLHSVAGKGKVRVHLMAGINMRKFGANAFYSPVFPDQYEETRTGLAALKVVGDQNRVQWQMDAYMRLNRDHFLLDRTDPQFYENNHRTSAAGADAGVRISTVAGITHTGFRVRREQIRSSSLGDPLDPGRVVVLNDTTVLAFGHGRILFNWNMNQVWEYGPVTLSGGFLLHMNSDLGPVPRISPGADVRFRLPGQIRLYGSANRSMRLPTFTDLYYEGPSNVGNPDLIPESARTFETGIYRQGRNLSAEIGFFFRQGRNLIDWIWIEEDQICHTLNLTRVDALGGDLWAAYRAESRDGKALQISSAFFNYTYTRLKKEGKEVVSRYVLDNLKHKVSLGTTVTTAADFLFSVRMTAQDRNGSYQAYDSLTGQYTRKPYDPFVLLDLKVGWSFGNFMVFTEVTNLLDRLYVDIGNLPQPGRWIMAGIEFR